MSKPSIDDLTNEMQRALLLARASDSFTRIEPWAREVVNDALAAVGHKPLIDVCSQLYEACCVLVGQRGFPEINSAAQRAIREAIANTQTHRCNPPFGTRAFKNVRPLGITSDTLSDEEYEMFPFGRVLRVHWIGDHQIIEVIPCRRVDDKFYRELGDPSQRAFIVNELSIGYGFSTLEGALLMSIAMKSFGPTSEAAHFAQHAMRVLRI